MRKENFAKKSATTWREHPQYWTHKSEGFTTLSTDTIKPRKINKVNLLTKIFINLYE